MSRLRSGGSVPVGVERVAAEAGLGDVVEAYEVACSVVAAGDLGKLKQVEVLQTVLIFVGLCVPLGLFLLIWQLGAVGLAVGVVVGLLLLAGFLVVRRTSRARREKHELVYVFRDGFVLAGANVVRPFRWVDFPSAYQASTEHFVNGRLVATGYQFRLVHADGRRVTFNGAEQPDKGPSSDILELGPVVLQEVLDRRLPSVVETVNAGGRVEFGDVAIGPDGISTPDGGVPWGQLTILEARAGLLFVGAGGRKSWQGKIADIPNFAIFWQLAQELRARQGA